MSDADPRDQILHLEARIEDLAETIEGCRKIDLASKITMAAGGLWTLAMTLGIVRADAMAVTGAMAAVIGGIVVFGSNASTWNQTAAGIRDAEALRVELIGRLELRVVQDGGMERS
jgi:hypothetical protein